MPVSFVDPAAQRSFDEKGYAILDLLSPPDLQALRELARASIPERFEGIFTNVLMLDRAANEPISDELERLLKPYVDGIVRDYVLGSSGTFIVKSASPDGTAFSLHQDSNIVDEHRFRSLALWVPVEDTDASNGGLCVLPGSHRLRFSVRCPTIPSLTIDFDPGIAPWVEQLRVRAGQACVFAHNLFHGSPPNRSTGLRPVVHAAMFPRAAQTIYFYQREDGGVTIVGFEPRAFGYTELQSLMRRELPAHMPVLGELASAPARLTRDEVIRFVANRQPGRPARTAGSAIRSTLAGAWTSIRQRLAPR